MSNIIAVNGKEIKFELIDGKPMISSREVAEHFGKQHKNFITRIENDPFYGEFITGLRIKPSKYIDASGKSNKMYLLDRDAFSYFVMSFTGRKAAEWKFNYIKAFNMMEAELKKKSQLDIRIPQTFAEALRAYADEVERREKLEHKVKQDAPKVEFAESVEVAHNSLLIGQFAKAISTDDCKIGQNRLFEWLRNKGYLIKSGARKNMPVQKYLELGYFEVVERTVENPDGSIRVTVTTKITGKGQVALTHLIKRDFCNHRPE